LALLLKAGRANPQRSRSTSTLAQMPTLKRTCNVQ
jgi:hypothetical protein